MRAIVIAVLLIPLGSYPAVAQQTRAAELAAQQAEKATRLEPYQPTRLERRIETIERGLLDPPPLYPYIGSIMAGGLLAVGPGLRLKLPAAAVFDAHWAYSLKNYKLGESSVNLPLAGGRAKARAEVRWMDAPGVAFFGIGPDTPASDRTAFSYRTITAGGSIEARPVRFVNAGGRLHYMRVNSDANRFSAPLEARTPGADADPHYVVTGAFAEIDWRDGAAYSRRGGRYRAEWTRYAQQNDGVHSFDRVDGEINQFLPLLRANWVIALRALASYTTTVNDNQVPHFLMPDLGGSRMLRGYASWRFRDANRMLLTGEYRWTAGQFVDMALFLDAGKVVPRRSEFSIDDLKTSYGLGVRFHTAASTPLRIEFARTGEGLALVFGFGPSF